MSNLNYERLTAQDIQFLVMESENTPMDIMSIQIFEMGPIQSEAGGLDIKTYRKWIESLLHRMPRYRQKLKWIPYLGEPVWVDDPQINLNYHIRHTALPRPGSTDQLKQLAARIMVSPLDRSKPLWELWFVEGLEKNRFALITKIHHCMLDGMGGMSLAHVLMSIVPDTTIEEAPMYVPRHEPSNAELISDEILRRTRFPIKVMRDMRNFWRSQEHPLFESRLRLSATFDAIEKMLYKAPESPFNGELSYHRRCDWMEMPLDDIKNMSKMRDCTVNDIVLTIVTSAIRKLYLKRGLSTDVAQFRLAMPVNRRQSKDEKKLGNHISIWLFDLPIQTENPLEQLTILNKTTRDLKSRKQALGMEAIFDLVDIAPTPLLSFMLKDNGKPFSNTIVTSVKGPKFPLYLLGAKMLEIYPQVPLLPGVGLGAALMSYNGKLFWGFNADYNLVPDIRTFCNGINESFQHLRKLTLKEPLALVHNKEKHGNQHKKSHSEKVHQG